MAEFNTVGLEDVIQAFERREQATVQAVPEMLKAGAEVLVQAQKAEAAAMGLNETGGFINSIKATPVKGDETEKHIDIFPQGGARPYQTSANEKAREKVSAAEREVWERMTNG